jgi:hypothetical protein
MGDDFVKLLFNKTIIKYVPKLQHTINQLKKKADKLKLPERNKIIYICYHLDDTHLARYDLKSPVPNNFTIYAKLDNYNYKKYNKKYIHNIKNYKYYIHTNTKFDGDEILEINNMKPYNWMNSILKSYDCPFLENNNVICNLHDNWMNPRTSIKINNIVLKKKGACYPNELKQVPSNTLKYKPFIVKKINTKLLYIKLGSFCIYDTKGNPIPDICLIKHKLKNKLAPIKYYRNKNIIIDIRGNGGGCQEVAYPFIEAVFGIDIRVFIQQKKQMEAIQYSNGKCIEVIEKDEIDYNVVNKFTGKLFVLMNYTSGSMSIIFVSWLKYLQSKFKINIIFIGTAIKYQHKLSNADIIKKYKKYNLLIECPSRYIYKHGIKNTNIVFTPDYYHDNMKKYNDHAYPEDDIPLSFIKKLIKRK